jgi:hypothetical protein
MFIYYIHLGEGSNFLTNLRVWEIVWAWFLTPNLDEAASGEAEAPSLPSQSQKEYGSKK